MPAKNECRFYETYGLVMCGGQSSRMGTDKSMLRYYDKPQRYQVYEMLQPYCQKVFIACNEDQVKNIEPKYNFIEDNESLGAIGPINALLTAFTKYPLKNILLVGCDYPFLTKEELQVFLVYCKNEPVAFYNTTDDVYEPMLAWYPYASLKALQKMYDAKQFSLQHFLIQNGAAKYLPSNTNCIKSIDTKDAFIQAFKRINE